MIIIKFSYILLLCNIVIINKIVYSINQIVNNQLYTPTWKGPSPNWYDPIMHNHGCYLIESYNKLTGKELIDTELYNKNKQEATKEMFLNMNRIVLSHGIQQDTNGPILNYANSAGLKLFAASWDELTTMPSRYTADTEMDRELRQQFMNEVTKNGIVNNYSGIRIGLNKVKFRIKQASVWNVIIDNNFIGQAATFDSYDFL